MFGAHICAESGSVGVLGEVVAGLLGGVGALVGLLEDGLGLTRSGPRCRRSAPPAAARRGSRPGLRQASQSCAEPTAAVGTAGLRHDRRRDQPRDRRRPRRRPRRPRRCAAASLPHAEPMAGYRAADTAWLLVEHRRPVGAQGGRREPAARGGPRLPRRASTGCGSSWFVATAGCPGPGVRVFAAQLTPDRARRLDRAARRPPTCSPSTSRRCRRRRPGLTAYDAPLWLVCTNGRRDRCCAEAGRPVAAALAGALAGGDLGDHPPRWAPLRRHPARAARRRGAGRLDAGRGRPPARSSRPAASRSESPGAGPARAARPGGRAAPARASSGSTGARRRPGRPVSTATRCAAHRRRRDWQVHVGVTPARPGGRAALTWTQVGGRVRGRRVGTTGPVRPHRSPCPAGPRAAD